MTVEQGIKSAALIAAVVSIVSCAAYFGAIPDAIPGYAFWVDNALVLLLGSTFLAAALLAMASRGWRRVIALSALVPSAAAVVLIAVFMLFEPRLENELIGLVGFALVELAPPVEAVLVGVVALSMVVNDARRFADSRRHQIGSS